MHDTSIIIRLCWTRSGEREGGVDSAHRIIIFYISRFVTCKLLKHTSHSVIRVERDVKLASIIDLRRGNSKMRCTVRGGHTFDKKAIRFNCARFIVL